jgi:Domain of unknown function (DUF397)
MWIKSTWSFANGNCVEVATLSGDQVGVRDSKRPDGPVLAFGREEFGAFLAGIKDGEFGAG